MRDSTDRIEEQMRQDWRDALACPGVRRIFGRMISVAVFTPSHCQGDSMSTAFNEGYRAGYMEIMNNIEVVKPGETAVLLAAALQESNHADETV